MADSVKRLWMVVRTDIHGTHYLVKEGFEGEAEAERHIADLVRPHHKPHGQEYDVYDYTPDTHHAAHEALHLKL